MVTLEAGKAEAMFSCAVSADPACSGRVAITAEWNSLTSGARVQVGDAGIPGTAGGSGGAGGGATAGGAGGGAGGSTAGGSGGGGGSAGSDGGTAGNGGGSGGSNDGGTAGGGTAGGAPPAPSRVPDAGGVYLLGLLTSTVDAGTYALADLANPDAPIVAFPAGFQPESLQLGPDGRVFYFESVSGRVMQLASDAFEQTRTGASRYPADPALNDTQSATPSCLMVTGFWVRPDTGAVVYGCGSGASHTYHEGSTSLLDLGGIDVLALGAGGAALGRSGTSDVVVDAQGDTHSINGLPAQGLAVLTGARARSPRWDGQGFLVVLGQPNTDTPPCELWRVDLAGGATKLDTFGGLPGSVTSSAECSGRVDRTGALHTLGRDGADDVVVVEPRMIGASSVAYSEAGSSPSNFSIFPPSVFTFVEPHAQLVTAP
ncbi:MAG: hypothetical protein IPJ65_27435 [Archangiaceae bacterium]|nr:hypothetical protein [Archangiaceae bacterium]